MFTFTNYRRDIPTKVIKAFTLSLLFLSISFSISGLTLKNKTSEYSTTACYQRKKAPFKKIGFVIRYDDPEAERLALALAQYAHEQNRAVFFEKENKATAEQLIKNISLKTSKNKRKAKICLTSKQHLAAKSDLIVAIGGDGTLLSVARLMSHTHSPPLLGIYKGTLGFLTEFSTQEALPFLSNLLAGKQFTLSSRPLLETAVIRDKKTIFTGQAANDAVIKLIGHRVLGIDIAINNKPAFSIYGDGLIVSTPSGSTAYSLSAGGPLVEPSTPALILTPLNATGITLRPVIIPNTSTIVVEIIKQPGTAQLSLDSQDVVDLKTGDRVLLKQPANKLFKLITRPNQNYFEVLKDKFKFGSAV